jgi:hypothetical protein
MIDLETNDIAHLSSKLNRNAAKTALFQTHLPVERAEEKVDNYIGKFCDAEANTEKATAVN